jgi:type II secretory pathway pseudopilin PulG
MIVMGIMIILAATSLVIFNPGEKQREQRDALRVAALTQIASTLELYYADNKKYPDTIAELIPYNSKVNDADPLGCLYIYTPSVDLASYKLVGPKESKNFTIPAGQKLINLGEDIEYTSECPSIESKPGSFVITSGEFTR